MMRCATYTLAFSLPIWGLGASFITGWYWLLILAGALVWITAGCVDWVCER